jgi:response regulator of citrate/malate metabolism
MADTPLGYHSHSSNLRPFLPRLIREPTKSYRQTTKLFYMPVTTHDLNQLATRAELSALERNLGERLDKLCELVAAMHSRMFASGNQQLDGKPKEFYSASEFAQEIGLSKNTVRRRCQDGTFKSTQPGGEGTAIMIPFSELQRIRKRAETLR